LFPFTLEQTLIHNINTIILNLIYLNLNVKTSSSYSQVKTRSYKKILVLLFFISQSLWRFHTGLTLPHLFCLSYNSICCGLFEFNDLKWELVVSFVGIVDRHCLNSLHNSFGMWEYRQYIYNDLIFFSDNRKRCHGSGVQSIHCTFVLLVTVFTKYILGKITSNSSIQLISSSIHNINV
jgi:hypothetical protein